MSRLTYHRTHDLEDPILLLAYAGWNDGGESATTAAQFLLEQLNAEKFASLDTEDYLDFTVVRPHVRREADGRREILWPNYEFFAAPGVAARDFVIGLGVEPHLRWPTFCRDMVDFASSIGVGRVILLGAFLDEVIYSQPIRVNGFASDPALAAELELRGSAYEGPTGIVGVLGEAFRAASADTVSLWARLPHYVAKSPNPRAALALLQQVERTTGARFDLSGLESQSVEFDREVSDEINADPQLSAYVRELKRRAFSQ